MTHHVGWVKNVDFLILIDCHFDEPMLIHKSQESICFQWMNEQIIQ